MRVVCAGGACCEIDDPERGGRDCALGLGLALVLATVVSGPNMRVYTEPTWGRSSRFFWGGALLDDLGSALDDHERGGRALVLVRALALDLGWTRTSTPGRYRPYCRGADVRGA